MGELLKAFAFASTPLTGQDGEDAAWMLTKLLLRILNRHATAGMGLPGNRGAANYLAACSYIDRHLAVGTLCLWMMATGLGLSKSRLHQAFKERRISVMQRVRSNRLEKCRAALADTQQRNRSVLQIATDEASRARPILAAP